MHFYEECGYEEYFLIKLLRYFQPHVEENLHHLKFNSFQNKF